MGIKKKGRENVLEVHVDQEKSKRSQKDMEMSEEVKEGLGIKEEKRLRLIKKGDQRREAYEGKGTTCCGKSMGNP